MRREHSGRRVAADRLLRGDSGILIACALLLLLECALDEAHPVYARARIRICMCRMVAPFDARKPQCVTCSNFIVCAAIILALLAVSIRTRRAHSICMCPMGGPHGKSICAAAAR